jgi:hypothetical protein
MISIPIAIEEFAIVCWLTTIIQPLDLSFTLLFRLLLVSVNLLTLHVPKSHIHLSLPKPFQRISPNEMPSATFRKKLFF